jgi:hypothetical protein
MAAKLIESNQGEQLGEAHFAQNFVFGERWACDYLLAAIAVNL